MAKQRRKKKKKGIGAYHTDRGPQNTKTDAFAYQDNPAYEDLTEIQKENLDSKSGGDLVADYTGTANPTKRQERIAYKQMKNDGFTAKSVKRIKNARKKYDKNVKKDGFFKATTDVLRAGKDAEDQRNENIDENINKKSFRRKSQRNEKKLGKLSEKQEKLRRRDIGIVEPLEARKSYQRKQARKINKAKKSKDPLDNPAQRFLSNTIDQVLASNTGSSSMNESPGGEVNSPVPLPSDEKLLKKQESEKVINSVIDKLINDDEFKKLPVEDQKKIIDGNINSFNDISKNISDMLNPGVNDKYKFLYNDPYNIKTATTADLSLDGESQGSTSTPAPVTGSAMAGVMNKQDGNVKKPTLTTESNLKEIERNLASSSGAAAEKLGLRDYYPEAGRSIAVGTFTGSRIGSQTIYSGAGMLAPLGMLDARKAAMQKAAQAKITALNGIKDSLGEASYQFDQSFQEKGINMINSYIQKHGSNPSAILSDINFRKDIKKYNSFAKSSKEITELVKEAQLKSVPNDKGEVAAHYTPGQLKEMNDFLNGAKDPDYMNDVLSGKINIGKIRESIDGKVQLSKLVDAKFKDLTNSKLERERPYNFEFKRGITEEEFNEAKGILQEIKTGKRETSNIYRSGVMKYFDWASKDNVTTMITKLAKDNNVNLNDKYGKDYVDETIDYLMAQMPSTSFIQNFEKIGNLNYAQYQAYENKKLEDQKFQNKKNLSLTDYSNYNLAENYSKKGTGTYHDVIAGSEKEDNIDKSTVFCYGYINNDQSTLRKFSLQELTNARSKNGEKIDFFQAENHSSIEGQTGDYLVTQYIDYSDGNPLKGEGIAPDASFKRNVLNTTVSDNNVDQNFTGNVITYQLNDLGEYDAVESPLIFTDTKSKVIDNGMVNRGGVQNVSNREKGSYRSDNTIRREIR